MHTEGQGPEVQLIALALEGSKHASGLRESSALGSARCRGHREPVPGARLVQLCVIGARERAEAGMACGGQVDGGGAHHHWPPLARWALARDQVKRRADAMSCGQGAEEPRVRSTLASAIAALTMAERS
jgi:hypothetical protein